MKEPLKRAFQLKKNDDLEILKKLNNRLKISSLMLSAARDEIEKIMYNRDQMINNILLDDFHYIIKVDDKVVYLDQINKIFVYNGTGDSGYKITAG